jgi:hypothetical protein
VKGLEGLLVSPGLVELYRDHPQEPECVRVAVREDDLVGGLAYRRSVLRIDAAGLALAYLREVSGESGKTAFRRTGEYELFDRLLGDTLDDLGRRDVPLAFAHGELALFTRHGFVPCFYHPRVSIPVKKAHALPSVHRIRNVMSADAAAIRRLMATNRRERPQFFATGVPDFHHYVVEGPGRRLEGYFSLAVDPDSDWHPKVFVPEVEVRSRGAAVTILRHCAEHAVGIGLRMLHFPLGRDHPFAVACVQHGGYFQLRGPTRDVTRDEEMIRITNLHAALRAMEGVLGDRLSAEDGEDENWELTLDMDGERASILVEKGKVTVEGDEIEHGPVIKIPRWAMTQLLLGYRTAREVPASALRSHRGRLSRLFPRRWPLSLCDHDLWETALRKKDDRYAPEVLKQIRTMRFPW